MDTTSNMVMRLLHLLATHPEAQEALRKEILDIQGGEGASYDQITTLPYLDAVIRETLRL